MAPKVRREVVLDDEATKNLPELSPRGTRKNRLQVWNEPKEVQFTEDATKPQREDDEDGEITDRGTAAEALEGGLEMAAQAVGAGAAAKRPTDRQYKTIYPRVPPLSLMPIETHYLHEAGPSGDYSANKVTGVVRLWAEMFGEDDKYSEVQFRNQKPQPYEVRVLVKDIKGISVFKDSGERNDVYVRATMQCRAPGYKAEKKVFKTDTHRWAREEASFNWLWVFTVHAPACYCTLEFSIIDEDTFTDNDHIYGDKVFPLDNLLMLQYEADSGQGEPLGVVPQKVIFDSYPNRQSELFATKDALQDLQSKSWCSSCIACITGRNPKPSKPKPATMTIEVEVVNSHEALLRPVEDGRQAEPKNRDSWGSALADPFRFAYNLIGPTMYLQVKTGCRLTVCVLVVLAVLAIIYLVIQIIEPISSLHKSHAS